MRILTGIFALSVLVCGCARTASSPVTHDESPRWYALNDSSVVTMNPSGTGNDTVSVKASRIVCMSTTHVGYLKEIDAQGMIVGISGLRYVSDPTVRKNAVEVGDLDYEKVISLHPDVLLSSGEGLADYRKLEQFGIKVLHLYDYMEQHPLARASYVRLMGALTDRRAQADSVYAAVSAAYHALVTEGATKVLINAPYRDAWYIPGRDSYMYRLVADAGGEILGSASGTNSSVISLEAAVELYSRADLWLNPGQFASINDLRSLSPILKDLPPLRVYNNNLHTTPEGGNDFYESGAARPDLVLNDLRSIINNNAGPENLHYYIELH